MNRSKYINNTNELPITYKLSHKINLKMIKDKPFDTSDFHFDRVSYGRLSHCI